MNILRIDINSLQFDDIVSFCSEKIVEGTQIEYKKDFPKKGLAKQFASMSNTRGGLIIIGIEEHGKTGAPKLWEGIKNDGKLIDRVHQCAAQVEPIPSYDVCVTDEKNGNVFILIRILEGDKTPYYVQNNENIWVRTGNISNPIDIASKEFQELLFRKKERAEKTRLINIDKANDIYEAALKRAEKERKDKPSSFKKPLGSNVSMLTILIQPYYPRETTLKPNEIRRSIQENQIRNKYGSAFPSYNHELIQEGTLFFEWNENGRLKCEQLFCNGLIFYSVDILSILDEKIRNIAIASIGNIFYQIMLFSQKYYELISFQGCLVGYISLSGLNDVNLFRIKLRSNPFSIPESKKPLLNEYKWCLDLESTNLSDKGFLLNLFTNKMNEIYESFNFLPKQQEFFNKSLIEAGW